MELSGERGWALKNPVSHGKRTGRERGRVGSSPTRRETTKTARDGGFSLRFRGWEQKRGEEEWGGEGGARLPAHFLTERGGRGEEWERTWERARRRSVRNRKQGVGGGLGKEELTCGPGLSAEEREREGKGGEGGWLAGLGPERGTRARGGVTGPPGRKEEGKENFFIIIIIFKQNFNAFSKWIFNQIDICFQNTHHIKECSSMNATIKFSLSLYQILISPNLFIFL